MLRASANGVARRRVWFTRNRLTTKSPAARAVQSARLHTEDFSVFALHTCCLKSWFTVVGDSSPRKNHARACFDAPDSVKGLPGLGAVRASGIEDFSQMCARVWPCLSPRLRVSEHIARKSYQKGPARPGCCNRHRPA